MKEFLEFLIQSIVNYPQEVAVQEKEVADVVSLTVKANPEDIKVIIGREGRTIKAIRNLLWVIATKQGKKINIVVGE
ncbi:RNA-binding protein [Candidatus Shapirobacteria bacterium CG09_land_8_20_14_0_10_47_13]|uniref:RNA-binding protein KhpA n=1 Tax=Candidatus Shapirobacteria bacterium CG09_land_8_20_14_0_10_47_13 TaxID=1974481 RepID=A0A2H0WMC1_9BACT|nr:MAG: RNA-binding protein [Candidatus Shapirobacteria bacterium CG09_land_8_20_14_0_10_47_13]